MNTLYFHLSKPSAQISERRGVPTLTRSNTEVFSDKNPQTHSKSPCFCGPSTSQRVKPNLSKSNKNFTPLCKETQINQKLKGLSIFSANKENILGDGDPADEGNTSGLNALSNTCQAAIKTTRIAIRNSFSQFNLFSASSISESEFFSFRYPLEVQGLKLPKNKWTHLTFSVFPTSNKEITVSNIKCFLFFYFFLV